MSALSLLNTFVLFSNHHLFVASTEDRIQSFDVKRLQETKLSSFALTRTLYLLIYNHTSYINLNVPDVWRNILGKRTDVCDGSEIDSKCNIHLSFIIVVRFKS